MVTDSAKIFVLQLLALFFSGCATVSFNVPKPYSKTITDTADTRLGKEVSRWVAAYLHRRSSLWRSSARAATPGAKIEDQDNKDQYHERCCRAVLWKMVETALIDNDRKVLRTASKQATRITHSQAAAFPLQVRTEF